MQTCTASLRALPDGLGVDLEANGFVIKKFEGWLSKAAAAAAKGKQIDSLVIAL